MHKHSHYIHILHTQACYLDGATAGGGGFRGTGEYTRGGASSSSLSASMVMASAGRNRLP